MGYLRRLHERLVAYAKLLLSEHRRPAEVAAAIFLGCVVGCLPLFGFHLFICIGVSRLLRLNLPVLYGAANISVPPLVPFLGWTSVELGERLLQGRFLPLHPAELSRSALPQFIKHFFIAWMLGGALLGAALGLVSGGVVYVLLRRRQRRATAAESALSSHDAIDAALRRAALRYKQTPARFRYYAAAKYRMDPCYRALCARTPEGTSVLDLGCGLGMLGVALAEFGGDRRSFGLDWDADKIAAGQKAAAGLPEVTLCHGDLRTAALPPCDVVTLVDVLHYYDAATQSAVLKRAVAALREGGWLFIRETDPERTGGARLTRLFERAMVRLGWNRGPKVHYRPLGELHQELAALGLYTEQLEVAGTTHPGNFLLTATRKPGG
jgi:uncharacterized protein (DUF2062 family)/SAM-dependent methyltransferase